jgi:hypothetical protein
MEAIILEFSVNIFVLFLLTGLFNSMCNEGGLLYPIFSRIDKPLRKLYRELHVLNDGPNNFGLIFDLEDKIRKAEYWRNPLYLCSTCQSFWVSLIPSFMYVTQKGFPLAFVFFMAAFVSGLHWLLNTLKK